MARRGLDIQTVLTAAAEIANATGADYLTLALVAEKLNVKSPSLYNHVAGLPELKRLLMLYGYGQLKEQLRAATTGREDVGALRSFAHAYIDFAKRQPGVYELTLKAPSGEDPELAKAGQELVDHLLQLMKACGLEGKDGVHAVRGLRSMVHGFAAIERQGGFGMPVDLNESIDFMMEIFIQGISGKAHQNDAET